VGEFDLGRCSGISTSGLYWGVFGIDVVMSPGSIRPYTSDPEAEANATEMAPWEERVCK